LSPAVYSRVDFEAGTGRPRPISCTFLNQSWQDDGLNWPTLWLAAALKECQRRLILPSMEARVTSILDDPIAQLLLSGEADNPSAAERLYRERHLDQVFELVQSSLSDEEFRRHPLIALLFSHGSRGWEDSLR